MFFINLSEWEKCGFFMTIQKVLPQTIKNVNYGALPFRAAQLPNNYVDYDTFVKSNAQVPSDENKQTPQAQAHYMPPQTQAIEPQEVQQVQVKPIPNKGLSGLWSFVKTVGVIAVASLCAHKLINFFNKNGSGFSKGPVEGSNFKLSEIWEDTKDFLGLNDLVLSEEQQKVTDNILNEIIYKKDLPNLGISSSNSILLYGPPGTGKTSLVEAIAKKLAEMIPGSKMASLDVKNLGSIYRSGTEQNLTKAVSAICEEAKKNPDKKIVVFIDEIDSIMMVDKGNGAKTSNEILTAFKTCFTDQLGKHDNIITIAATNRMIDPKTAIILDNGKQLDNTMLDRFVSKHFIGLPSKEQVLQKIANHYKNCALVDDCLKSKDNEGLKKIINAIFEKSDNDHQFSYRRAEALIKKAGNSLLNSSDYKSGESKVGLKHFIQAIQDMKEELNFTDAEIQKLASDLGVKIS